MTKGLLAVPLVLAGGVLACTLAVPANPTYDNDVRPIFVAHCVRCHGSDDMLHAMLVNGRSQPPGFCYLQRYEDEGDCSMPTDPSLGCKMGAGNTLLCTTQIVSKINRADELRMPPPPSDPLTDWEKDVMNRWAANGFPK